MGLIGTKAHENVGNSAVGVVRESQGVPKMFRAPICRAHCAVIFAIAQLFCCPFLWALTDTNRFAVGLRFLLTGRIETWMNRSSIHLCRVAGNTVWSHMASSYEIGVPLTAIHSFIFLPFKVSKCWWNFERLEQWYRSLSEFSAA